MHLPPLGLQKGGNNGKAATPTGSRFGMVCPLSILGTSQKSRSRRGAASTSRGRPGRERGAVWAKLLVPLVCRSAAFWSSYSVSPSTPPPPCSIAKYLKMFLRGSELLTNPGKMLWKTLSTKTDKPEQLVQILGLWQFLFKAEREGGGGVEACLC